MSLNYPGYTAPQPYDQNPDIAGNFVRSYKAVRTPIDENNAAQSLSALGQGLEQPADGTDKPALAQYGLPAREVLLPMLQNPQTRDQALTLIRDATAKRDEATDPLRKLQIAKASYDVQHQGDVAPTAEQRNYQMAANDPKFAEFIGASGASKAPPEVQTYLFYRDQATKAGQTPLGFMEYKDRLAQANDKPPGLTEVSPNATLFDPVTKQPVFTAPATAGDSAGVDAAALPVVQLVQNGAPDTDQQKAFYDALGDPGKAALLKQVIDYRAPIDKVTSMRGGERQAFAALAAQADPTFDMTQYTARAKARQAYTTGQQGQTITSANTVIGHLSNLADDAGKLGNGDFVPLNAVSNAWKGATSNPDLSKFNSDKMAVASELAKFFKGTGATDLTTTTEWQGIFDQNTGPGALKAVVQNVIGNLMKSRLDEMRSQFSSVMGKPSDFRFITPETDSVLKKLGIDTSAIDPTFGGQITTPGGGGGDASIDDLLTKYSN